jgi:hypothetical protein
MNYDVKIEQDRIYLVEKEDENKTLTKKQRRIFSDAERNLRKVVMERLEGKGGDC